MTESHDIDLLKLYFGDPYPITDSIIAYTPTIQDILDYGEQQFFAMAYVFIGNTTFRRLDLWDAGVDWNKISDYQLFGSLVRVFPVEKTRILFGDVDFSKFEFMERVLPPEKLSADVEEDDKPKKKPTHYEKQQKEFADFEKKVTLYNAEQGIEISASTYRYMAEIVRWMFHSFPKTEYTFGKTAKEIIIQEERDKRKKAQKESKGSSSVLLPLISSCVNHPGFKYKTSELREVHISEFMDSVQRLQVYEATHALLGGMYSGFCDTSKIPRDNFNFMRELDQ